MSGIYCVFAKWPKPGRVKTRLARAIGERAAAGLAMAFLEDTIHGFARDGVDIVLALDDLTATFSLPVPVRVWPQGDGDLGKRMSRVLSLALERNAWAVAYGTDSPTLPASRRGAAVEALSRPDGPDAVIGPARDGGYYLLGVRKLPHECLDGVRWGTADACTDTIERLRDKGLRVVELEPWYDVDDVTDLATLASDLASDGRVAPRTLAVMLSEPRLAELRSAFALDKSSWR